MKLMVMVERRGRGGAMKVTVMMVMMAAVRGLRKDEDDEERERESEKEEEAAKEVAELRGNWADDNAGEEEELGQLGRGEMVAGREPVRAGPRERAITQAGVAEEQVCEAVLDGEEGGDVGGADGTMLKRLREQSEEEEEEGEEEEKAERGGVGVSVGPRRVQGGIQVC
ncbi:hypothetical protein CRG98_027410 [Punica granatum]|uniref:Uncharacterized protein n=1 Tax=Punica granatum TaxID=22663 RepID=A0A2I0J7M6_PUNGR|nr:hypothetical protein CRG98_027410 [Punica granatum]